MNEWEKNRRMAESYRQSYPPGTRLELIGMDDPFAPIPAGMRGTVNYVDDQSQIHVKWDNGAGLPLSRTQTVFVGCPQKRLRRRMRRRVLS